MKVKIVTKLHRYFIHSNRKKLCDLLRKARIKDSEFIKISLEIPNSYEICCDTKGLNVDSLLGSYKDHISMKALQWIKRSMAIRYYTWSTMVQDTVLESGFLERKVLTSLVPSSSMRWHILELQNSFSLIIVGNLITNCLRTWHKTWIL